MNAQLMVAFILGNVTGISTGIFVNMVRAIRRYQRQIDTNLQRLGMTHEEWAHYYGELHRLDKAERKASRRARRDMRRMYPDPKARERE